VPQDEAAAIIGLHLEKAVAGVLPAIQYGDYRQAANAQVEHPRLAFAGLARVTANAYLHGPILSAGNHASTRPGGMRRLGEGGQREAACAAAANTLAGRSAAGACCQAHKVRAAAMYRALAKLTGFFMPGIGSPLP
jgi:hypothetical protein